LNINWPIIRNISETGREITEDSGVMLPSSKIIITEITPVNMLQNTALLFSLKWKLPINAGINTRLMLPKASAMEIILWT